MLRRRLALPALSVVDTGFLSALHNGIAIAQSQHDLDEPTVELSIQCKLVVRLVSGLSEQNLDRQQGR